MLQLGVHMYTDMYSYLFWRGRTVQMMFLSFAENKIDIQFLKISKHFLSILLNMCTNI